MSPLLDAMLTGALLGVCIGSVAWFLYQFASAVSYARDMASLQRERRAAERKYRPGGREDQRERDRIQANLARWKRGEFTPAELQQLNEGVE